MLVQPRRGASVAAKLLVVLGAATVLLAVAWTATYSLLDGKDKVDAALKRIADIQNGRKTTVRETPLVTSGAQVIGR